MQINKCYKVIITFFLINLNFISISCSNELFDKHIDREQQTITLQETCLKEGGKWQRFSDGCADNCDRYDKQKNISCIMVITYSCEIGRAHV